MNVDQELDNLLRDSPHDLRGLACELLEFKLREVPRLQRRITTLEVEKEILQDVIVSSEAEVECGGPSDSDITESELYSHTEYDGSNAPGDRYRDSPLDSETSSGVSGYQESMNFEGSLIIPRGWFETEPSRCLPVDILYIVFDFLMPPREMVGLLTIGGARNGLCRVIRTKTTLALVCRTWHSVALKFLYGDVVLRRADQILNFSRSISEDPLALGRLVKRLSFVCFPHYGITPGVQQAVTSIFTNCPSLEYLSFAGFLESTKSVGQIVLRTRSDLCAGAQHRVERIEYTPTTRLTLWSLYVPSGTFRNLRSLEVVMGAEAVEPYAEALQLPLVDTLALHCPRVYPPSHIQPYPHDWDMPCLKHLRFRSEQSIDPLPATAHSLAFFDKFGPSLLSLDFGPHSPNGTYGSLSIETVLEKCLSLEHLVFKPNLRWSSPQNLQHRAHIHVDLIIPNAHMNTTRELVICCRGQARLVGTGWKSVRFFEEVILEVLPDLPHSPTLPRTRAEDDISTGGIRSYGYQICVVPSQWGNLDVPELIFYERRI